MPLMPLHSSATVPVSYGAVLLDTLLQRGFEEKAVLRDTRMDRTALQNRHTRMTLTQYTVMLLNAHRLGALDGLAYEIGLRNSATKHGFVGHGTMTCVNVREAIAFSKRYFCARLPWACIPCMSEEADEAVVSLEESQLLSNELRSFVLDMVLIELCCLYSSIGDTTGSKDWKCGIWVPHTEPLTYARYKQRLPRFDFNKPAAQIRLPAKLLDYPIATTDLAATHLNIKLWESEMLELGSGSTFSIQVLNQIACHGGHYPDADEIARRLCISNRTMERRLRNEGNSFQGLLNQVRRTDGERMLANSMLSVKQVAQALGYEYASNFTRAFANWTGLSPNEWRSERGIG